MRAEKSRIDLGIRTSDVLMRAGSLSGGNQQKVVLAKWLAMSPRFIIFDEPTRGMDVGAKSEIYRLMRSLADKAVAVLMISSDTGLFVLILVVGAVVALINPLFLSPINIANTANLVGLFGMFSIARAFVIITGGIDLSFGSMIALLGVIFVDLIANLGVPWPLAVPIVLVIGFLLGLAHGLLITKRCMQPLVVTLCGLPIYRGIARFYTQDATAGFPFGVRFGTLEFITTGRTDLLALASHGAMTSISIPHSFFLMLTLAAVMWVVLHRSVFGRYLYAVGKNEEAARFSGIRTDRVIIARTSLC